MVTSLQTMSRLIPRRCISAIPPKKLATCALIELAREQESEQRASTPLNQPQFHLVPSSEETLDKLSPFDKLAAFNRVSKSFSCFSVFHC